MSAFLLYIGIASCFLLVSFTDVARYVFITLVPFLFLVQKFFFKRSVNEVLFFSGKSTLFFAIATGLIPVLFAVLQGEDFTINVREHWINHRSSLAPLALFLYANFLLVTAKHKTVNPSPSFIVTLSKNYSVYIALALLLMSLVELAYSIYSFFYGSNLSDHRLEGSAGNPQPWAVELAIYALIYILFRKSIEKSFPKPFVKVLLGFLPFTLIFSMLFSGSVSNVLALAFASLSLIPVNPAYILMMALAFIGFINYEIFSHIQTFNGDIASLKAKLGAVASKFIPRIKLWYLSLQKVQAINWNPFLGVGYQKYASLITKGTGTDHLHNVFYHNFILYGYFGLLMPFLALFTNLKDILSDRIYLAIFLYVLCSSCLDPAFQIFGPMGIFFFTLPFIIQQRKS